MTSSSFLSLTFPPFFGGAFFPSAAGASPSFFSAGALVSLAGAFAALSAY